MAMLISHHTDRTDLDPGRCAFVVQCIWVVDLYKLVSVSCQCDNTWTSAVHVDRLSTAVAPLCIPRRRTWLVVNADGEPAAVLSKVGLRAGAHPDAAREHPSEVRGDFLCSRPKVSWEVAELHTVVSQGFPAKPIHLRIRVIHPDVNDSDACLTDAFST